MRNLMIGLLAILFASPVSAGCAWVVWASTSDFQSPVPVNGFETKELCEKEIGWLGRQQSGQKELNPSGKHVEMIWRCLPDTIDPRK